MIVDSAIYSGGVRVKEVPLKSMAEACASKEGFAWVGLYEPEEEELAEVSREFGLHELAVEDALRVHHQRPKIERYGDSLLAVLKPARYVDATEALEFGEIYVFTGVSYVVVVRYGEVSKLSEVRARLEGEPRLLERGPLAVLYGILDYVVDGYAPVTEGLENDIDEIEAEVFGGNPGVSRRIYTLFREIIQFRRSVHPLPGMLERMITEENLVGDRELRRYLRDVRDHVIRIDEQVEGFRELLSSILNVNLTLVGIDQNHQVQKISAWAAILIVPTIIAGIYGMNFRYMPELDWTFGYPFALLLMVGVSVLLYAGFRRSGWL